MRPLAFLPLAALLASLPAAAMPVDLIPDPRPASAVVDQTGTLTDEDRAVIDLYASRGRSRGQLVVVVIDSVDGAVPRTFATQLFNRWKLDTRERNRGVLFLAALRDRKAEIVVGDGFGGVTGTTDRIMRESVIASFKRGDQRQALVEGARALVDDLILVREDLPAETPVAPAPAADPSPASAIPAVVPPSASPESTGGSSPPAVLRARDWAGGSPLTFWGGLGGILLGAWAGVRRYLRMRPRVCPGCQQKMLRLDEAADDAHLSAGEKIEEQLGSVDYDLWMCPGCHHTLKLRYGSFFTSYSKCPSCSYQTVKITTTTVTAATQYSTGTARVVEDCQQCSYNRTYTRTIPRKPKPSSSSSRSGSSSSRRSSGGSSSGRGSSGSW
ncbi:MAG: TPM domain-containing protein [Deltaproteobacteria bacterium]|nr:TPM domain-containing protein [Deltaproteobacteria bacterium]